MQILSRYALVYVVPVKKEKKKARNKKTGFLLINEIQIRFNVFVICTLLFVLSAKQSKRLFSLCWSNNQNMICFIKLMNWSQSSDL